MDYSTSSDSFLSELVRSPYTIRNYRRAIALFVGDHDDGAHFEPPPLPSLGKAHRALLVRYVQWLLEMRALSPTTTELYAVAVRRWFQWMAVNEHLPATFPIQQALAALSDALKTSLFQHDRRPPEPPEGIEQVIVYFDRLWPQSDNPKQAARERLEIFRNSALIHVLAETGGRINEVLQLRLSDFPPSSAINDVWRVRVRGKRNHEYELRFLDSLPYIHTYIKARNEIDDGPLFVHHSKRYENTPMSAQTAQHAIRRACRALELKPMSPHDFRHYRATQLVNADVSLDIVQEYLGHRSVETTRGYYAKTRAERIDDAMRKTRK